VNFYYSGLLSIHSSSKIALILKIKKKSFVFAKMSLGSDFVILISQLIKRHADCFLLYQLAVEAQRP